MKSDITVGDTFTYRMKTTEDMSATQYQESSPPVFATPHLVGLGAIEVSRCDYLDRLAELAGAAGPDWAKSSPYTAG